MINSVHPVDESAACCTGGQTGVPLVSCTSIIKTSPLSSVWQVNGQSLNELNLFEQIGRFNISAKGSLLGDVSLTGGLQVVF